MEGPSSNNTRAIQKEQNYNSQMSEFTVTGCYQIKTKINCTSQQEKCPGKPVNRYSNWTVTLTINNEEDAYLYGDPPHEIIQLYPIFMTLKSILEHYI